ncbi:hypothetical protein DL98DRAFT_522335 [Cadophora sp. DSE1049]|nr:hypothetical protein DL98DRAFT_522335 [Cadophora sp. DSE1049]
MFNSSTTAPPPSLPVTIEKPTKDAGGRDKTGPERNRKISRSGNLGKKASGMERGAERSEGGVIKVRERGGDEGGDETSLFVSFPQFCATCEKQIVTPNSSQLFCSEACRLCDSPTDVSVVSPTNGSTDDRSTNWTHLIISCV